MSHEGRRRMGRRIEMDMGCGSTGSRVCEDIRMIIMDGWTKRARVLDGWMGVYCMVDVVHSLT